MHGESGAADGERQQAYTDQLFHLHGVSPVVVSP